MVATNSGEHKVNWNTKIGDPNHRHRIVKSMGNMVFLRGDGVYDNQDEIDEIFHDPSTLASQAVQSSTASGRSVVQVYRDSHRMFGNEKVASILSNNQSQMPAVNSALSKATAML